MNDEDWLKRLQATERLEKRLKWIVILFSLSLVIAFLIGVYYET